MHSFQWINSKVAINFSAWLASNFFCIEKIIGKLAHLKFLNFFQLHTEKWFLKSMKSEKFHQKWVCFIFQSFQKFIFQHEIQKLPKFWMCGFTNNFSRSYQKNLKLSILNLRSLYFLGSTVNLSFFYIWKFLRVDFSKEKSKNFKYFQLV